MSIDMKTPTDMHMWYNNPPLESIPLMDITLLERWIRKRIWYLRQEDVDCALDDEPWGSVGAEISTTALDDILHNERI